LAASLSRDSLSTIHDECNDSYRLSDETSYLSQSFSLSSSSVCLSFHICRLVSTLYQYSVPFLAFIIFPLYAATFSL
jgi:hypothetical protein